jgi:hypothetical protein
VIVAPWLDIVAIRVIIARVQIVTVALVSLRGSIGSRLMSILKLLLLQANMNIVKFEHRGAIKRLIIHCHCLYMYAYSSPRGTLYFPILTVNCAY